VFHGTLLSGSAGGLDYTYARYYFHIGIIVHKSALETIWARTGSDSTIFQEEWVKFVVFLSLSSLLNFLLPQCPLASSWLWHLGSLIVVVVCGFVASLELLLNIGACPIVNIQEVK